MFKNYEYRFEFKPGRFVYLPTDESRAVGKKIRREVLRRWQPNSVFFHLLRRGGHIVALRRHLAQRFFGKRDIEHFFGKVTRTKVCRALRSVGFDNETAFDMAVQSTVDAEIGKHVPYGFVQSPVMATLALEKSALGSFLTNQTPKQITVSAFVDDISFSSNDEAALQDYGTRLDESADTAGFPFAQDKTVVCEKSVEVFNCALENQGLEITQDRLAKFLTQLETANELGRESIIRYVNEINPEQADELASSFRG